MSNFKQFDKVIYIPTNKKGQVLASIGDLPFDNEFVFESEDKSFICRAAEKDLKLIPELTEEQIQNALMQTMQRCQEVYNTLSEEGKLDSTLIGSIDWYEESEFKMSLCREYEDTYSGTAAYEENYTDSTEAFFRVKLLERFGFKKPMKVYRCEMTETTTFHVLADSDISVQDYLIQHTSSDVRKRISEHTGYHMEYKEDVLSSSDYMPDSKYDFEMIELGGVC